MDGWFIDNSSMTVFQLKLNTNKSSIYYIQALRRNFLFLYFIDIEGAEKVIKQQFLEGKLLLANNRTDSVRPFLFEK